MAALHLPAEMCTFEEWASDVSRAFQTGRGGGRASEEAGVVPFVPPTPPLPTSFLAEGLIYGGFPAIRQRQQRWLH